jgi:hypothetical protein
MLKLLLDEHISPEVANGVQRRNRSLVVHSMVQWESGNFLGKEDSACLLEAAKQRLTLVTYDRRTIPPLLKLWAEEGRSHGGVIFVDEKTISPADHWRTSPRSELRSPARSGTWTGPTKCTSCGGDGSPRSYNATREHSLLATFGES